VLTGDQIKEARVGLKLSQVQLANLVAVHPMTIYKWENNLSVPERTQEQLLVGLYTVYEQERSKQARLDLGRAIGIALVTGGALLGLAAVFSALYPSKPNLPKS